MQTRSLIQDYFIGTTLLSVYFFQAIFVSGVLPIVHQAIPDQADLAYSCYFLGLVLGQALIYQFQRLSSKRIYYSYFECLFGLSLLSMGWFYSFKPFSLIVGRFLEGIAGGLSMPLGFVYVSHLPVFGDLKRRISLFNSAFILGMVVGPSLISQLLVWQSPEKIFECFGLGFIVLTGGIAFNASRMNSAFELQKSTSKWGSQNGDLSWFDTFYTLFLAKCFYGFLLPYLAGTLIDQLQPFTISQITLIASGVSILGQMISVLITRWFSKDDLKVSLPLLLMVTLGSSILFQKPVLMLGSVFIHSSLIFLSYLCIASHPGTSREFARLNCLTDAGMLIGSSLAHFSQEGAKGICLLCLFPLLLRLFRKEVVLSQS